MFEIDPSIFLSRYCNSCPAPRGEAESGLQLLLKLISQDPDVTDVRWAAYMLATVKHECADQWQPIEEFGKGAGRVYGEPVTITDTSGTELVNTYYGRGFVQLTFQANYEKIGRELGLGNDLLFHPELALQTDIAYRIMSYGMRHGIFTGKSLAEYIRNDVCDYFNARRIINGLDRAAEIQQYAEMLEAALRASLNDRILPAPPTNLTAVRSTDAPP